MLGDYRLFALHDSCPEKKRLGAFEIDEKKAEDYNNQGFGIFWLVNQFDGERKSKNCTKINVWYADLDDGTKVEQLERINSLPLKPSMIVETKKGYHCYWDAINATLENFAEIERGIIKKLNADKHCTDTSRLLRFPYTYHMKNPKEPYLIEVPYSNDKAYTEEEMLYIFKLPPVEIKKRYDAKESDLLDETKWEKIFKLNQIRQGERNCTLTKYVFWLRDTGLSPDVIENVIERMNTKLYEPLPDYEIKALLRGKF